MRPEYANAFGLRKVSDKEGQLLEVTLDISYKYMENAITVNAQGGIENVATPAADTIASIVMNRQSAISLRNLLIQTLRDSFMCGSSPLWRYSYPGGSNPGCRG